MKIRSFLAAAVALLICVLAGAQQYDALDQAKNDWRKISGMEGPHRFDTAPIAKAPKGYKPFYISHYGRHGSRYAWNWRTYTRIHDVLEQGHNQGKLTAIGEEFYQAYEPFYKDPLLNTGDLTPLGFEQHKKIGEFTVANFPQVFKGAKKVNAIVSTSQRSIVSMSSYCLALKGYNPKLDIYQSSTHIGMVVAAPVSAPGEYRRKYVGRTEPLGIESTASFRDRIMDYDSINARLFNDPEFINGFEGGMESFCWELYSFLGGYRNYCEEPIFQNVVSPEQMARMWEYSNYCSYYGDFNNRYDNIALLEDVVNKADAALADPAMAADLRFGHDYVIEAFACLINANGCGTQAANADEAKYWFQNYNIPMAATMMFVFYRNKKGDVLFRLIWNEEDATLPQLKPVEGCLYRWSDFREWAMNLMAEHPQI